MIRITSSPAGASVRRTSSWVFMGKTPIEFEVTPGRIGIHLAGTGHDPTSFVLRVGEGETVVHHVDLEATVVLDETRPVSISRKVERLPPVKVESPVPSRKAESLLSLFGSRSGRSSTPQTGGRWSPMSSSAAGIRVSLAARKRKQANRLGTEGRAFLSQGNTEMAKTRFRTAMRVDPRWSAPHIWLGSLLLKEKAYDEAISVLLPASRSFPKDLEIQSQLGLAYILADRLAEADRALARAQSLTAAGSSSRKTIVNLRSKLRTHRAHQKQLATQKTLRTINAIANLVRGLR